MAGIRYKGQIFSGAASFGDADQVAYDNTESGLEATDVQGALDEVSNAGGVSYDNTTSGLTATDVQAAVDELTINVGKFRHIASGDLMYGGDTFTFDFSDSKYARKLFVLFVTGGVYLINIWMGSAQLFTALSTTSGTVSLSGKTLTVTVGQNLSILYGLYQVN